MGMREFIGSTLLNAKKTNEIRGAYRTFAGDVLVLNGQITNGLASFDIARIKSTGYKTSQCLHIKEVKLNDETIERVTEIALQNFCA